MCSGKCLCRAHCGGFAGGGKSIATSPAELLRGKMSGVRVSATDGNPNGHYNVNIRGLNTLRGDSQPLWIVDGAVIGSYVNHNLDAFYLSGGTTINGDQYPDYSGRSYTSPVGNFGWLNPYEIESIEVIKDMSAAALYGMQGANGVIIVKTRKPVSGEHNVWLNSNVGVDMSSQNGDAFKNGIITTHDIGINGLFGTNSFYNISGFLRYDDTAVMNTGSTSGAVSVNMETMANEIFQFGLNSRLHYGNYTSSSGTNFIGSPSTMILARYPEAFEKDKLGDWIKSYDDEVLDCRTVNSVWLNINFHRTLSLKLSGGADYQNQTRYIWFGNSTSFGKEFSGATSILNNSLMNYNFKGELKFNRNFAVKHHLQAAAAFDLNGYNNRTNAMCGTDFDLPYLRGKGLSSSGSIHAIRKFETAYTRMGGYAFLGYDFDGYFGVTGALRADYTLRFDDGCILLPSGEAFVDFHKIFLGGSKAVSTLKLSGGYGKAGKEMVLPYEYLPAYMSNIPEIEVGSEPYFDGINRLISEEWNIGLNMGFVQDRINLAFKYYDKKTDDSFRIYNFGKVLANMWVGTSMHEIFHERTSSLSNNGFEIDADFTFLNNSNVKWTARANAAYNLNEITLLDALDFNLPEIVKGKYLSEYAVGEPVGQIFSENTLPKISGGFGTTFSVKGFTLDADFSGAGGFKLINANKLVESGLDYFSPDILERGDYLRLDCLSLSYRVPLRVRWIRSFKVNLSAHNLFTITDYSGWNPDVNSFGVNVRSYGIDYGSYPLRRQIVFGVSFRF